MKIFGGLLAAVGFFVIYVAASTSDYETMPHSGFHGAPHQLWEFVVAALIGLALLAFGLWLAKREGR